MNETKCEHGKRETKLEGKLQDIKCCYRCTLSSKDSILLKRGDDEELAAVTASAWLSNKPRSREFCFRQENATLGNLLQASLMKDPRVRIAAQRVDHPTDTDVKVMVDLKSLPWQSCPDVIADVLGHQVRLLKDLERQLSGLLP